MINYLKNLLYSNLLKTTYGNFLGIDYPTLWYLVIGLLFSGYAILEGFDFGAGAWHLFLEKI